jgi:hypothetical protein
LVRMLSWPPRAAVFLCVFSACAHDSGPPPHTATTPRESPVPSEPACRPSDRLLAEHLSLTPRSGATLEFVCDRPHPCQNLVTVVLENRGPNLLSVESLVLEIKGAEPHPPRELLAGPIALAAGARHTHDVELVGGVNVGLLLRVEECGQSRSQSSTFSTSAEVLRRAEAECAACNGEYGPHGMRRIPSCVCRTSDAGRPCDGGDCEGQCLLDEQPKCDGVPCRVAPVGLVGRCSEFRTVFGCRTRLTKGRRVTTLCLD